MKEAQIDTDIRALFQRGTMTPDVIAHIISRRYNVALSADDVYMRNERMPPRSAYCATCGRVTKLAREFMSHKDGCVVCARRTYADALRAVLDYPQ